MTPCMTTLQQENVHIAVLQAIAQIAGMSEGQAQHMHALDTHLYAACILCRRGIIACWISRVLHNC